MKSAARPFAIALAGLAGVVAVVLYVRSATHTGEAPPARDNLKPSDRVRARLEQLRAEHPDWHGQGEGAIHAANGPHAERQHLPDGSHGSVPPANLAPQDPQAAEPGDGANVLDEDPEDVPTMKKIALEDSDPDRRLAAVTMLGASEDPEAIPVLAQALSDSDEEVRMAALQALADFTDEPPVEAIENALNDPTPDIRFEALSVLADVGGERARAVVEKALNDPDEDVRNLAEGILDMESVYEPAPAPQGAANQPPPTQQAR